MWRSQTRGISETVADRYPPSGRYSGNHRERTNYGSFGGVGYAYPRIIEGGDVFGDPVIQIEQPLFTEHHRGDPGNRLSVGIQSEDGVL